jgi:hypothetical protein
MAKAEVIGTRKCNYVLPSILHKPVMPPRRYSAKNLIIKTPVKTTRNYEHATKLTPI